MKIPQIGWNGIFDLQPHPLLEGVAADDEFYFVHSYYPVPDRDAQVMARCEYGGTVFAAAIGRGSIFATQFHPEKSGKPGLRIVENFCHWDGTPCSENA
jgi:glutamine amidotransferase